MNIYFSLMIWGMAVQSLITMFKLLWGWEISAEQQFSTFLFDMVMLIVVNSTLFFYKKIGITK